MYRHFISKGLRKRITESNLKVICAKEVHIIKSERAGFRLLFTIEIHIINFPDRRECLSAENRKRTKERNKKLNNETE